MPTPENTSLTALSQGSTTTLSEMVNILLVDDRDDKLLALETILADLGQNLVLARSGQEALRLLLNHEFAVIVLDVHMPGMDGFDTAVLIRQRRNSELTPIIFISAVNYSDIHLTRGYSLGAIDYILAPIVPEILRAKVGFFVELYKKTEQLKRQAEIQAQLIRAEAARKEAEAANQAKDRFLAMLSHELRMPLTPILFSASLLSKDEKLPDQVRQEMAGIVHNVQLEARLIDDLLDIARINQGKLTVTLEPANAHTLIESALRVCAESIKAKSLTVRRDFKAINALVSADPARLSQVFWNLIQNAIKFTPAKGKIRIRTTNPLTGSFVLEVADSGVGIAPEALPKIFDPFEQVTIGSSGGLGLGLSISKTIVEMHHGQISASSEGQNQGARFVIELPNLIRETAELDTPATAVDHPALAAEQKKISRILLVDDHHDTVEAVRRYLSYLGYHVTIAEDLETAWRCAGQERFDLLICDIALPDGRGEQLVRRVRDQGHQLPAIAVSGFGAEADIVRSRAAGFTKHLTKPVLPQHLKTVIEELLG